ncbi:MAG: hypothetical protein IJ680_03035, partial [Paludibacteraceae bacterium]|nr:hypothetical protein [Paludibacteraceae bacterium]
QGELRNPLIPGYDTNDGQYSTEHINYLQRKSVFPYKYLLIGVAVAFLIGLFIPAPWGGHGKSSGAQNGQEQAPTVNTDGVPNPTPDPSGTPAGKTFQNNDGAEQPQAALNNSTSDEGIKTYLTHNNTKWVKDSLLRYEPIGDSVWDAFARFDRDKIKRLFPRNYDKIGNGPKINNLLDLVKDGSKWQQPADSIYQKANEIVLDNWYNKCCKGVEKKTGSTTHEETKPAVPAGKVIRTSRDSAMY